MSKSVAARGSGVFSSVDWLLFDDNPLSEAEISVQPEPPFDLINSISFATLLLEEKQTRRAAAMEHRMPEVRSLNSSNERTVGSLCDGWDAYDFMAVAGIVLALIGLILVLIPATRSGGVLLPIGAGMTAAATYGARRRDQADA